MKERILGVFSNIDDAKNAFGQIKKATWNQVELAVVFGDSVNRQEDYMELAVEGFIETSPTPQKIWPGVQEKFIEGLGQFYVGESPQHPIDLNNKDTLDFIKRETSNQHIIGIIDAEPEVISKIQLIMESNGGEIFLEQ